jgi:sugar lactone lactonase YvrE
MNTKGGYANLSLIKSNKCELKQAGARFSRASITILCSVAALLAPGPAGGAEIIYLPNSGGNTIEMYDASTGTDLGVFANTGLSSPAGLAFDSAGNLYVANAGDGMIEKFTTNGVGIVFASGLHGPTGVAFDSAGNLYVVNHDNRTIEKFTTNGVGSVFGSTTDTPSEGLACDSAGNLYVDFWSGRIENFTPDGVGSNFVGTGQDPRGLAFDGAGNLYVANYSDDRTIQKFTPGGFDSVFVSGVVANPVGLVFGSGGILYVSARGNNGNPEIMKFAPDGTCLGGFGTGQNGPGLISIRVDNPPLIAVCSSNITVAATDSSGATVSYVSSTRGGCNGASITCVPPSGSTFPIGTTTVSCLATDSCGQTASCDFTVTIVKPPLIAVCSSNIQATPTSPSGATVFYTASTSGGCSGASITCVPPSGSSFPIGTTMVSCLATDSCGQTASCAFTVTIPPLMAVCSPKVAVRATDSSGATVFYTSSTSGGCSGASITCDPPSGSTFPIGTTTVSCLATDSCGETASCDFTVTVRPPLGWSGTNTVTSLADSGPGSLRQVLADSAAGDAIVFGVTGTIALASGELVLSKDLAIIGPGPYALAISGGGSRVFSINSNVTALISSLAVTNGRAPANGGGIYNAGTLRLDNLILSGNTTAFGTNGESVTLYDYGQPGGPGGSGGGIWNGGTCFANRCSFSGNSAGPGGSGSSGRYGGGGGGAGGSGGGICNGGGAMALTNCTVSNNSCGGGGQAGGGDLSGGYGGSGGQGGGVYSQDSLVLIGCTIANNQSGSGGYGGGAWSGWPGGGGRGGDGGGVCSSGLLVLTNCTLGGNSCGTGGAANTAGWGPFPPGGAGGSGGGICCYYTKAVVATCTIAGNTTGLGGGPGRGAAGVDGTGGGVYAPPSDASFSLLDDIVALNSAINAGQGPDVYGAFNSLGHNLIGATNDSSGLIAPGDLTGSRASPLDPKLGPLEDNGGPTLTMALLPGSPAIDTGDTTAAPPTDQRGVPRPFSLAADIGAFEFWPTLRASPAGAGGLDILASGISGQTCRLLASSNFLNWMPFATNQIGTNGTVLFYDNYAPGSVCRFYRLMMP